MGALRAAAKCLIIYLWTRGDPTLADSTSAEQPAGGNAGSRRRDLALVALLLVLNQGYILAAMSGGPVSVAWRDLRTGLLAAGWDPELGGWAANAAMNSLGMLLPALAATFALGLRPRQVGLAPRRLDLALFLVLVGVAFAYYRTRSIWPGVLWHASFTTLGALFW